MIDNVNIIVLKTNNSMRKSNHLFCRRLNAFEYDTVAFCLNQDMFGRIQTTMMAGLRRV